MPSVPIFGGNAAATAGLPLRRSSIPPGHFVAWDVEPDGASLHCLLGENPPKVTRGYGGWSTQNRPGRWAVSVWPGGDTPAFTIDLLLENDVIHTSEGAAGKMRDLERLAGWDRRDVPPPTLVWSANAPHHDLAAAPQNRWVCESLEWGDLVFSDRSTLLYAEATLVVGLKIGAELPKLAHARGFVRRTLKVGWDLRDFARKHLGDPKRWKDVAELNRDNPKCPTTPTFKVSKPLLLRVPPREGKARKRR